MTFLSLLSSSSTIELSGSNSSSYQLPPKDYHDRDEPEQMMQAISLRDVSYFDVPPT